MKTKLELIKDVYGPHYETCTPDENGWTVLCANFLSPSPPNMLGIKLTDIELHPDDMTKWRPVALNGLEENNGWTSIAEHGLPNNQGDYWVVELGKAHTFRFNPNRKESVSAWTKRFTHWKPLDSRLPLHL